MKSNKTLLFKDESLVNNITKDIENISISELPIKIYYDETRDITVIETLNQIIIKNELSEFLVISDKNIIINGSINIENSVNCNDGFFTNMIKANDIYADNIINAKEISTEKITISTIETDTIIANQISISDIISQNNINIRTFNDNTINIPNIKFNTTISDFGIINATEIKNNKVFIIDKTTIIQSDEFCDGIEIIIYNNSIAENIIRDNTSVIVRLEPRSAIKLIYLLLVNRWIII